MTVKNTKKYRIRLCLCSQRCGMCSAVRHKDMHKPVKQCVVHHLRPCKWVRQTAAVLQDVVREKRIEAMCLQEMPVCMCTSTGRFGSGCNGSIDLVCIVGERVIAIEVHGSREHMDCPGAIDRDKRKASAVSASACALCVIWAPELVGGDDGGPLTEDDWYRYAADRLAACMCNGNV